MSNRRDKFNDDWSEYAKRDNRKRNHDKDRSARDRKHSFDESTIIATQIFRC